MPKDSSSHDLNHRFVIESADVRGQFAQLDLTWREIQRRVVYPPVVRDVLGQACAAIALLGGILKFDGKITLQIRGAGPLHLLVAQITNAGGLRAVARWHDALPDTTDLQQLCPDGQLMVSIERTRGEPYTGTVELTHPALAQTLANYFSSSEQTGTALWLAADEQRCAGLFLQRLPSAQAIGQDEADENWNRVNYLAETVTANELLTLHADDLLFRLFNEERVRIFDPGPVSFSCSCSRQRSAGLLRALGSEELQALAAEQEVVTVTCEFCGCEYLFDAVDCRQLESTTHIDSVGQTRH
ncbi:MAG: Hsp33 family molecular chaperone HslO [Gammaproteobacteria bacterium]|nr:Hsp33 family molecular chaperone HslO [Gammaproteobacteria bacterium]